MGLKGERDYRQIQLFILVFTRLVLIVVSFPAVLLAVEFTHKV